MKEHVPCLSCGARLTAAAEYHDGYAAFCCNACGLRRQLIVSEPSDASDSSVRDRSPGLITFDGTGGGRAMRGYGWRPPERWGCWTIAPFALVSVPCDASVPVELKIDLRFVTRDEKPEPFPFELFVQARLVGSYKLTGAFDQTIVVRTPLAPAASGGLIEVEFRNLERRVPKAWGAGDLTDPVGIGLRSIAITKGAA